VGVLTALRLLCSHGRVEWGTGPVSPECAWRGAIDVSAAQSSVCSESAAGRQQHVSVSASATSRARCPPLFGARGNGRVERRPAQLARYKAQQKAHTRCWRGRRPNWPGARVAEGYGPAVGAEVIGAGCGICSVGNWEPAGDRDAVSVSRAVLAHACATQVGFCAISAARCLCVLLLRRCSLQPDSGRVRLLFSAALVALAGGLRRCAEGASTM
jgi:hypothetical protein